MMKKIVSLLLALVMVLAAVSAFAAPKNISEIQDLPEFPAVPAMKVKSVDTVTIVTLDSPVSWLAVVRNYVQTILQFNENNVAMYSTAGQKVAPGFKVYGWNSDTVYEYEYIPLVLYETADADTSDWIDGSFRDGYSEETENGSYGSHIHYREWLTKHVPGYEAQVPDAYTFDDFEYDENGDKIDGTFKTYKYLFRRNVLIDSPKEDDSLVEKRIQGAIDEIVASGLFTREEVEEWLSGQTLEHEYFPEGYITEDTSYRRVWGGTTDMIYAYEGDTAEGIRVRYDSHGRLVSAAVTLTGKNYLGLEQVPAKSVVTFSTGINAAGKSVVYVSNITEEIDENTSVSADFAQNGKCLRIK